MSARPAPLSKNTTFWALLALSVLTTAGGLAIALPRISAMDLALTMQTITTGAEVYVGQAWVMLGSAVTGAGIVGILVSLGIAAVSTSLAARAVVTEPQVASEEPTPESAKVTDDASAKLFESEPSAQESETSANAEQTRATEHVSTR